MFDLTLVVLSYKDTVNKIIIPTSIIFINDFAQRTYKYSNCDRPTVVRFFSFTGKKYQTVSTIATLEGKKLVPDAISTIQML